MEKTTFSLNRYLRLWNNTSIMNYDVYYYVLLFDAIIAAGVLVYYRFKRRNYGTNKESK